MLSSAVLTQPQAPRPCNGQNRGARLSAETLRDEIASCKRTVANQVASPLKGPAPARSTVETVGWAAAAVELAAVTVTGGEAKTVV